RNVRQRRHRPLRPHRLGRANEDKELRRRSRRQEILRQADRRKDGQGLRGEITAGGDSAKPQAADGQRTRTSKLMMPVSRACSGAVNSQRSTDEPTSLGSIVKMASRSVFVLPFTYSRRCVRLSETMTLVIGWPPVLVYLR